MTYLLTVLAGVASTLAATSLVQLHVVPRVEGRKLREDRWERDVRALGELLAFTFADAAINLYRALIIEVTTSARRDDLQPSELQKVRDEQAKRLHDAKQDFDRACHQVTWLVDEIASPAFADRRRLRDLDEAMLRFLNGRAAIKDVIERQHPQLSLVDAQAATSTMESAVGGLRGAVRRLSTSAPPRTDGMIRRITRRTWRQVLRPYRTIKRRQAEREEDELVAWAREELADVP